MPVKFSAPGARRREAETRAAAPALAEGAATVERILSAAVRIMSRDGELEPNMRDLLKDSGISTRAFYRHFPSKAALISVVVEDIYHEMLDSLQSAVLRAEGPEEQLKAWIAAALDYAADPELATRGRALVLHQAQLSREYAAVYEEAGRALNGQVAAILNQGIAAGVFRSAKPHADARLIVSLTIANLQRHVLLVSNPPAHEAAELADFVLRTLR